MRGAVTMTRYLKVLALVSLSILMLVSLAVYIQSARQPQETVKDDGIGGDYRICFVHSGYYHILDPFIGTLVSLEEFSEWSLPLRAKMAAGHGECLINLSTFIEHFGITREQMQRLIDDTRIDFFLEYNLDVLFSGDRALIEAYYAIENEELHVQMASEREDKHFTEKLIRLQRLVNKNAKMSRYYHDIWTYVSFWPPQGKRQAFQWMQSLAETGQYDRINIVEFVHHRRDVMLPRWAFERDATEYNMHIFTHYNLDVIYSGDPQLVARYYSKETEPIHTAQVRAAFERFVSKYGQPNKNPRLD